MCTSQARRIREGYLFWVCSFSVLFTCKVSLYFQMQNKIYWITVILPLFLIVISNGKDIKIELMNWTYVVKEDPPPPSSPRYNDKIINLLCLLFFFLLLKNFRQLKWFFPGCNTPPHPPKNDATCLPIDIY